ncbi:MAG TPA: putative quinol monooxygenase [Devosiaceae bacterium]|jgi:quinol monooxygenase YgiN
MYGLIGRMLAKPGRREELLAAMTDSSQAMPGCISYVVARDGENPDALWITEVWDDAAAHKASLQLDSVKAAIATAMPLIAGFDSRSVTEPVSVFLKR